MGVVIAIDADSGDFGKIYYSISDNQKLVYALYIIIQMYIIVVCTIYNSTVGHMTSAVPRAMVHVRTCAVAYSQDLVGAQLLA